MRRKKIGQKEGSEIWDNKKKQGHKKNFQISSETPMKLKLLLRLFPPLYSTILYSTLLYSTLRYAGQTQPSQQNNSNGPASKRGKHNNSSEEEAKSQATTTSSTTEDDSAARAGRYHQLEP